MIDTPRPTDDADGNTAPHASRPAMIQVQQRQVDAIIALNEDRGRLESEITEQYESAIAKAESRRKEQTFEIQQQYDIDARALDDEYRARTSEIKKIHKTELKLNEEKTAARRQEITDKSTHSFDEADKKLQDAIWTAESVFEAREDQPKQAYEKLEKIIQTQIDALDQFDQESQAVMKMNRQRTPDAPAATTSGDAPSADDFQRTLEDATARAQENLTALQHLRIGRFSRGIIPVALMIPFAAAGAAILYAIRGWDFTGTDPLHVTLAAAGGIVLGIVVLIAIHHAARRKTLALYEPIAQDRTNAQSMANAVLEIAAAKRDAEERSMRENRDRDIAAAKEKHGPIIEQITSRRDYHLNRIEERYNENLEKVEEKRAHDSEEHERDYATRTRQLTSTRDAKLRAIEDEYERVTRDARETYENDWSALERRWHDGTHEFQTFSSDSMAMSRKHFPEWTDPGWAQWHPAADVRSLIRFGQLTLNLADLPGGLPVDERLRLESGTTFQLPAVLQVPQAASMLFQTDGDGRPLALETLQNMMLRLLTTLPPGKVQFTILDPVGLGQNFAGFMHLADYDQALVSDRIWTEPHHIEQRLLDLTEHMETVIQKYLRNEFETIAEYNVSAGEIAEPYRFLVLADFPARFSEQAIARLASIINSGARCGVYTLIHHDLRQQLPNGIDIQDIEKQSIHLLHQKGKLEWKDESLGRVPLSLDHAADEEFVSRMMHKVGHFAKESSDVQVPFEAVAPKPEEVWTLSSSHDLRVPLGRCGATKLQYLELGRGTSQHALIAGKTGSGKSTLLHVLISTLAMWYSPDEVELYLVDFKKGVEFKTYASHELPHARVIAIESEREFGLSVLQRLDAELRRRGNVFRDLGVQGLPEYRALNTGEAMPRTLLIIDEFQEFFVEDDKIAQDAALLLDRLVRQGRAFGIHVLLGSQTIGGAYSLARSTLGQMAIRIALQCSEADSYLILNEDNAAARLLSRPGEAIYNNASGLVEGNSPFQIVWQSEEGRDKHLRGLTSRLAEWQPDHHRRPRPLVFEGNVPADLERNRALAKLLDQPDWTDAPHSPCAWLGDAVAIKDPTAATFSRHSSSNMIMIGQRDEAALAMMMSSMLSLSAQHTPGTASFYVLDGAPPDAPHAGRIAELGRHLPQQTHVVEYREVPDAMELIHAEMHKRQDSHKTDAPAIYVFVHWLQRFRQLRFEEDFSFSMDAADKPPSPDKLFAEILRDGPPVGIHVITWCDTVNNMNRTLDRGAMREFGLRVIFQMSSADSTNLIDTPAASKLGLRRALFYDEEQGTLEKFRPYALPLDSWIEEELEKLNRRPAAESFATRRLSTNTLPKKGEDDAAPKADAVDEFADDYNPFADIESPTPPPPPPPPPPSDS